MNAHTMLTGKYCHYFNNSKHCPFEEVGCMFKHAVSENCRFKKNCKIKLCQFQHSDSEKINTCSVDDEIDVDESLHTIINMDKSENNCIDGQERLLDHLNDDDNSDEDSEEEMEDLECDDCGMVSKDFDSYIEHRGIGDCVSYCKYCDKTFRVEDDWIKHTENHCEKCSKEFNIKKLRTAHMEKCHGKLK